MYVLALSQQNAIFPYSVWWPQMFRWPANFHKRAYTEKHKTKISLKYGKCLQGPLTL